eukprot:6182463-Pleurochrysis_carterae.AAC.3
MSLPSTLHVEIAGEGMWLMTRVLVQRHAQSKSVTSYSNGVALLEFENERDQHAGPEDTNGEQLVMRYFRVMVHDETTCRSTLEKEIGEASQRDDQAMWRKGWSTARCHTDTRRAPA